MSMSDTIYSLLAIENDYDQLEWTKSGGQTFPRFAEIYLDISLSINKADSE